MKAEIAGAALLLLIVLNRQNAVPDLGGLARDFHRIVGIMEKIDSLGQMAASPPQLPEPAQLINTGALPDMETLMAAAAPLLSNLGKEK